MMPHVALEQATNPKKAIDVATSAAVNSMSGLGKDRMDNYALRLLLLYFEPGRALNQ